MIPIDSIAGYVGEIFSQFWPHTALVIGVILSGEYAHRIKSLLRGE